jgi:hypothetical protein
MFDGPTTSTYSTEQARQAAGVPLPRFNQWIARGHMPSPRPGAGKARHWTFGEVLIAAVFADLSALGIEPARAGLIAGSVTFPITETNRVLVVPRSGKMEQVAWGQIAGRSMPELLRSVSRHRVIGGVPVASTILVDLAIVETTVRDALEGLTRGS